MTHLDHGLASGNQYECLAAAKFLILSKYKPKQMPENYISGLSLFKIIVKDFTGYPGVVAQLL